MSDSVELRGLDTVLGNLNRWREIVHRAVHNAGLEIAELLANYAKTHHLWGNPYSEGYTPTGATDASTMAQITEETREYVRVVLSAGMEYNVFLELARQGRWAWLWPAIEACQDDVMAILKRHLSDTTG